MRRVVDKKPRSKFSRGQVVPILCAYCGYVFDHVVEGPGRLPKLCDETVNGCRESGEARYYTRTEQRRCSHGKGTSR